MLKLSILQDVTSPMKFKVVLKFDDFDVPYPAGSTSPLALTPPQTEDAILPASPPPSCTNREQMQSAVFKRCKFSLGLCAISGSIWIQKWVSAGGTHPWLEGTPSWGRVSFFQSIPL